MSKISQELKALFYLNQRHARTTYVKIHEIADYLSVTPRQARRYIEDLCLVSDLDIETKLGRDGGYRLRTPLDKGFELPENIVLALSIAMKRNEKVEEVLTRIPNYVITDYVSGDNRIDNALMDKLETLMQAIADERELSLCYEGHEKLYVVQPYRIYFTNHTYYLYLVHDEAIKKFDVAKIQDMTRLSTFKMNPKTLEEIKRRTSRYGIKDGKAMTLRVRCKDETALKVFDKYFEHKGTMDQDNLIYEVTGNSENELYYPLFRISTGSYEFVDSSFKENYIHYLESQIKALRRYTR